MLKLDFLRYHQQPTVHFRAPDRAKTERMTTRNCYIVTPYIHGRQHF